MSKTGSQTRVPDRPVAGVVGRRDIFVTVRICRLFRLGKVECFTAQNLG